MSTDMIAPLPSETLKAFAGDELRARIFHDKYALRSRDGAPLEQTPQQLWSRVARGIAAVEAPEKQQEWTERFLWLLSDYRMMPGGRILHAVGSPYHVTALNCYVFPSPVDSIAGIYNTARELAETFKRGGGCGVDISSLRPKAAPVRNAARTSTGAVSFMELYSLTTGVIGQEGRRGALMLTIADSHPDVLDFCRVKRNLDKVRYANISVRLTDAFMRAVQQNGEWVLHYENAEDRIEVTRVIKARELWDELLIGARNFAEPGCLFWDTVQRFSSSDQYPDMAVVSTNPCVTGDTLVAVADGRLHVPIAQLAAEERDVPVYCRDNTTGALCIRWMRHPRKTGKAVPVYRVRLDDGSSVRATADHKFLLNSGEYCAVAALQPGDGLRLLTRFAASLTEVLGQGRSQDDYYWLRADSRTQAEHRVIATFFGHSLRRDNVCALAKWAALIAGVEHVEADPRTVRLFQQYTVQGYACRIIANRVYVVKHCEICKGEFLARHDRREQGVCSRGCRMRSRWQQGEDWAGQRRTVQRRRENLREQQLDIYTRLQYDLKRPPLKKEWYHACRAAGVSAEILRSGAPFQSWRALQNAAEHYNHRVVSVEFDGYADVYNGTVDEHHNFYVGGFAGVTRSGKDKQVYINNMNCGEQPLEPYGDCCLGSLNLAAFVRAPFTPAAILDEQALERATRYTVRFLDDVLTWNRGHHPLPQQEEAAERGRRIGGGILGLADMLCQLGLRYDSDQAIAYTDQLMERIKLWAYDESANLAKEKGVFPAFSAERHFANPFFASFPAQLLDKLAHHGLRNVTLLTVPPTGTVAALAGSTSGIEPIFDLTYTRRSESLSQDEFTVVHPLVARYRTIHNLPPDGLLPECFATAHTISPEKRVLMQATIQKHVDQSLSSTVNLPRETSVETVAQVYRRAWEMGAKGITCYREGSREGILLTHRDAHQTRAPEIAPEVRIAPRPPVLAGVTFREETPVGTAFITINYRDQHPNEPFEVFLRLGKAGSDVEADAEALGRLISLTLRLPSPMPPLERLKEICAQLEMIGGARSIGFGPSRVRSMPDGIARTLGRYLEAADNGTAHAAFAASLPVALTKPQGMDSATQLLVGASASGHYCPRCRQAALIVSEGCLRCVECGFKEC